MASATVTIKEALHRARLLLQHKSDAPELDAEQLLLSVLNLSESSWLQAHSDTSLASNQYNQLLILLARRSAGEPLAYILGFADFYGRSFKVTNQVLIPRPTTEDLVALALMAISQLAQEKGRPLRIADIGTGSGCIAITLALETTLQQVEMIYATDISNSALHIADQNISLHNVADHVHLLQGDMLTPIQNKYVDLIVSNPPYVPTEELASNHKNSSPNTAGLAYEPSLALEGGDDGQKYINKILASGIPAVIEVTHGDVKVFNLETK